MKSSLSILLLSLGGIFGVLARYGLSGVIQGNRVGFPVGTLVVNIVGCLAMGVLGRWLEIGIVKPELRYLLGLGFLGAFTTFSSFSYETLRLLLAHNITAALLNVAGSLIGCLLAVFIGYKAAALIWG